MTDTPTLIVRDATPGDAAAIAEIYNQGIEDRLATLETERRSTEERQAWLAERSARHPVLVALDAGRVVGWASLNRFNPRAAYDHVADLSVYVDRDWRGHGVGRLLLAKLEERARQIGYHKLVLAAFPTNTAGGCTNAAAFGRSASTRSRGCSTGAGSTCC